MEWYVRVPLGFVIMGIGLLMMFKVETLMEWFGEIDWAEEKMGSGQSRLAYKFLAILVAFIGIFIMTNIISDILSAFAKVFVR